MAEEDVSDSFRCGSFPEGAMLGHYRLEWFIGRNSTGEMYSAVNVENNKSCSLTVVFPSVSKHAPEVAAQLLRKAQEACFFCQPAVIRVQEAFSLTGCHCIVTDYFSGESAEQLLLRGGLAESQVLNIITQLAQLLTAAESVPGLIPEFTPDTLFIDSRGDVKIFYPGLKNLLPLLPGRVIASERSLMKFVDFTAPELLLGTKQQDIRSAMYSLGMLMCYLLCGRTFCEGENICQTMASVLSAEACDIAAAAPRVSPETAALISLLTAKDPDRRPGSGLELLKALGINVPRQNGKLPWLVLGGAAAFIVMAGLFGTAGYLGYKKYFSQEESFFTKLDDLGGDAQVESVPREKEVIRKPSGSAEKVTPQALPVRRRALPEKTVQKREFVQVQEEPAAVPKAAAKQKLTSAAPVLRMKASLDTRIEYCRNRLQVLEEELAGGELRPGIVELHKQRIEFRKRQIRELESYRKLVEERSRKQGVAKNQALNTQLRSEVESWLRRFPNHSRFMQYRLQLRQRRGEAFPITKFMAPGVDFSTQCTVVPEIKRIVMQGRNQGEGVSLADLLLDDILVPAADGANLLARLRVPLPDINQGILLRISRDPRVEDQTIRYLAAEAFQSKNYFSTDAFVNFYGINPRGLFLLEQILVFSGRVSPSSLYYAVMREKAHLEMIRLLLRAEAFLEYRNKEGQTPLFLAVMNGCKEGADLLLQAGADESVRDKHGRCAGDYQVYGQLLNAIRNNDTQQLSAAITAGANLNFLWQNYMTPLTYACALGKKECAVLLLEKGADPNYVPGRTSPLEFCLKRNKEGVEIFKLLLDKGADPNKVSGMPLMERLCFQRPLYAETPRFAELLLESGKCKVTPAQLFQACRSYAVPLFRVLLEKGSDLNSSACKNLMSEALKRQMPPDVIKLLLRRKAPLPERRELVRLLSQLDSAEVKALFANLHSSEEKKISSVGQSRKIKNSGGPGLRLANSGWEDRLALFIKNDRRAELENYMKLRRISPDSIVNEMTMLQLAAKHDSTSVIAMLLENNADPFKYSYKNRNDAVITAVKHGNFASFNLLADSLPPHDVQHFTCVEEICKNNIGEAFLKVYLQKHADAIKKRDVCLLTVVLEDKVDERYVFQLIRFYGRLDARKHRGVVHQAVASRYSAGVIRALQRHHAPTGNRAEVVIKDSKRGTRRYTATVPEIIRLLKMDHEYKKSFRREVRR